MTIRPSTRVSRVFPPLLLALSLIGASGAADAQQSANCYWGSSTEATALNMCQGAWDQSAANTTCSGATVTVDMTACTCNVSATCDKDDGTTADASFSDDSPDDFNTVKNCNGTLQLEAC